MYESYYRGPVTGQKLETSLSIASYLREVGSADMAQLRAIYGTEAIRVAIERDRVIHPEARVTRQGIATFYVAN